MSQQVIVDACARELDRRGAWHFNIHPACGRNGLPDRMAVYRGTALAIEFKSGRAKLEKLQAFELRRAADAGAEACVVRSADELRAILDAIDDRLGGPAEDQAA